MDNQIFISYRRDGGDVTAKLICEALKNRGFSVFYDYDTLKGGYFDTRICNAIERCNDVVLVLPPRALDRCSNSDDWLRIEIRHALQHGKNIIPVMLKGFEFPHRLPADIAAISRFNGVRFDMSFYEAVIDKIVEKLSSASRCGAPPEMLRDEPITLLTQNGDQITFIPIAVINYRGVLYSILQPEELIEGMEEDEALVFKMTQDAYGQARYEIELDDAIINAVFAEYERLLEAEDN